MTAYVILFFLLASLAFFEIYGRSKNDIFSGDHQSKSSNLYVLIPLAVVLFLGIFREITVGYDGNAYYIYYWLPIENISWKTLFTNYSIDNGFYLILKIISLFTDDWWVARGILFTLTFTLYSIVLQKESPYFAMSLIIFFGLAMLGLMFGILRQALAGAVVMHAYRQIHKGSWIKCLALILIATTIHKTALICVFMLVLNFFKIKEFSGIKLFLLSIFAYIVFVAVIPLLTAIYADARYGEIAEHDGGYGMLLFLIVVIALIMHLMHITETYNDKELSCLFNLVCGALFIQIGALQFSLLNRIAVYFSIYLCILIPKLLHKLPKPKKMQYSLVFVALFGFMFFYQIADIEMFVLHQFLK